MLVALASFGGLIVEYSDNVDGVHVGFTVLVDDTGTKMTESVEIVDLSEMVAGSITSVGEETGTNMIESDVAEKRSPL